MVLCIIALPVFAILGLFSLKFRKLTMESLECMFRTVTFRRCRSGLDDRIRSGFTGKLMRVNSGLAKVFYKNYKLISWILLIVFIWATYTSAVGIYNYNIYGNCNGPESTGFCLLDPTGANSGTSGVGGSIHGERIFPVVEGDDYIFGNPDAELTIIEFGCFRCPYTKKAESIITEVLEHYEGRVNLQFKNMILPAHSLSYEAGLAGNCALEQDSYEEYHDLLFARQETIDYNGFFDIARELELDMPRFEMCLRDEKYEDEVRADSLSGVNALIQGTPTFFINDKVIVGPKPFKTFKRIIDKELG